MKENTALLKKFPGSHQSLSCLLADNHCRLPWQEHRPSIATV